MYFNYNGVCQRCGCGTTGEGSSRFQSDYELCFGCGMIKWYQPRELNDGEEIPSDNGGIIMVEGKKVAFGTCLTKDYKLITFTKMPSKDTIDELKENAINLVIWNEENEWLDVIVGNPLMRKDVILLEKNYSIKEYINEPEYIEDENTFANVDNIPTDENIQPVNHTDMPY